jgi:hypothetical protein
LKALPSIPPPESSDNFLKGVPAMIHPNTRISVFRIAM